MNLFKKTIFTRTLFFVAADVFFIALSVWLALLLRFDGQIPQQYFYPMYKMILLAIIFVIPSFYFHRLYSFSWSYVSAPEAIFLFTAVSIAFILLSIVFFLFYSFSIIVFPRSAFFASYIMIFIFCGALRFAKRIYLYLTRQNKTVFGKKTLIVGAGDAGEQILRSIIYSKNSPYRPVGFVDDNPEKQKILIHGFKVWGRISDIPKIVKTHRVDQLIIALPTAGGKTIKNAVEIGKTSGVKKIKIVPHISEIINGEVSLKSLKEVDAGDLLGRNPVTIDTKQINNLIKGKSVLITGAAGSIGFELSVQAAKFNPSLLLLLDQDETGIFNVIGEIKEKFSGLNVQPLIADIADKERIKKIFREFHPKIVFHAAAYKHVPLMEQNPDEAIKNNVFGTENLAKACLDSETERFIFISTDKAVNPISAMGATKRIGEMICQSYNQKNNTKFISVRFGNVLNSRGSVIPIFKKQIKEGGPVQVTHPDMKRYFMLTSEACLLVMQAGAMGRGGEVFVLDMGEPIRILDLAKDMIKMSGFEPDKDIAIVFTGPRPGEKLFEEILTAEEGTIATQNEKIFIAKLSEVDSAELEKKINELKKGMETMQNREAIKYLKSMIK